MLGGEQAVRAPWRIALAYVRAAEAPTSSHSARFLRVNLLVVEGMLERHVNSPLFSIAGRLFDAVAAFPIRIRDPVSHEGQGAMELECLAFGASVGDSCSLRADRPNGRREDRTLGGTRRSRHRRPVARRGPRARGCARKCLSSSIRPGPGNSRCVPQTRCLRAPTRDGLSAALIGHAARQVGVQSDEAAIIGSVVRDHPGMVVSRSSEGGGRVVSLLADE
jgi:hydrogenase maturation HypF-like protein